MSKNYYVLCDDDCKYLAMTKEQTLTAIEQAVATGSITDVDGAIISKIREIRADASISFWLGTEAQFNAEGLTASSFIPRMTEDGTIYLLSDDSVLAGWKEEIYNEAVETVARGENLLYNPYFAYHGSTVPNADYSEGWTYDANIVKGFHSSMGALVNPATAGFILVQDRSIVKSYPYFLTIEWKADGDDFNTKNRTVVKIEDEDEVAVTINGVTVYAVATSARFHLQLRTAQSDKTAFWINALKLEANTMATAITPSAKDGLQMQTTRALANEEALAVFAGKVKMIKEKRIEFTNGVATLNDSFITASSIVLAISPYSTNTIAVAGATVETGKATIGLVDKSYTGGKAYDYIIFTP